MSYSVANYPGVLETSGHDIARKMKRQAQQSGWDIISNADVVRFGLSGIEKVVEVADEGTLTAGAVILATGGIPRTLGIPSEQAFKGRGISYCATCDGDFFSGKHVVAIGGGNSALEEAVSLTRYAEPVTVVHEFDHFQAHGRH